MRVALALWALVFALTARAQEVSLQTEDQQLAYVLGAVAAQRMNLLAMGFDRQEIDAVVLGFLDTASERPSRVPLHALLPKIPEFQKRRAEAVYEAEVKASAAFLEKLARSAEVKKTVSGLIIETLTEGSGPSPGPNSKVRVSYQGKLRDGRVFDSSQSRGGPMEIKLNAVIKCWNEGVQEMKAGGRARLYCPSSLAYGQRGMPPLIKPGAALVFEIDLLEVLD